MPAASEESWPAELMALADRFSAGLPIEEGRLPSLRTFAQQQAAVALNPHKREVLLHTADRRRSIRYCFEPLSPTVPQARSAPPTVALPRTTKTAKSSAISTISATDYLAASQSVGGQPPFDQGGRICHRFVLRTLRTPVPEVKPELDKLNGPALIVGRNAVAVELRKQIESLGGQALVIPLSDDVAKTLAALDTIWQAYRPLHLFLVTAWDADAASDLSHPAWERRRRRGVTLPYLICQKWFTLISDNKLVEKASVAAAVSMGGDFGLSGRVTSVESGALTGLVKGLCIEIGIATNWAFRTKVVDAPQSEPPAAVAAALLRELRAGSPFLETGYIADHRYANCVMPKPLGAVGENGPTRGRPWLITGGARGITAAVAHELGARFGVKLHLVGASPRKQLDPAVHQLSADAAQAIPRSTGQTSHRRKETAGRRLEELGKDGRNRPRRCATCRPRASPPSITPATWAIAWPWPG